MKTLPNILITGTPGTGKSTLCEVLEQESDLTWVNVSKLAKDTNCLDGYDEHRDCPILDEEQVLDEMEDLISKGGCIVEYHNCDFFPERFFDIVFVLRTDNTLLYDRLRARGYEGRKLNDNMECEILAVIRDEAKESYDENIVHELTSNSTEDMQSNIDRILGWIELWKNNA